MAGGGSLLYFKVSNRVYIVYRKIVCAEKHVFCGEVGEWVGA